LRGFWGIKVIPEPGVRQWWNIGSGRNFDVDASGQYTRT
jgi:hypothetical protein